MAAAKLALSFADRLFAGDGPYGQMLDSINTATMAAMAIRCESPWEVHDVAQKALTALSSDLVRPFIVARIEADQKKREREYEEQLKRGKGKARR